MNKTPTILIADDDSQIRRGLQKILQNHFSQPLEILTAENGLAALHLMEGDVIDLLITDIKMPLYTGLDLLDEIQRKKYHVRTIVLSGYQDYALVRTAMKHGALDYLLKPLDLDEFVRLVRSILIQLHQRNLPESSPATLTPYVQQEFIRRLTQTDSESFLALCQQYGLSKENPGSIILFDRNLFHQQIGFEDFLHLIRETLSSIPDTSYACGQTKEYIALCVFWTNPSSFNQDAFIQSTKPLFIDDQFHLNFAFDTIAHLPAQYKQLQSQTESWFYDLALDSEPAQQSLEELYQQIILCSVGHKAQQAVTILHQLFSHINASKPSRSQVSKIIFDLFDALMQKESSFIRIIGKYKLSNFDLPTIITQSTSLSQMKTQISEALYVYIQDYEEAETLQNEHLIRKAKEYIKQHYMDNLQLQDVANYVHLHPNYFSSIFASKTGTTFREYLRKIRISHAQKLLCHSDQKIYEVATSVGYKETSHFNRAFKEVTGLSPKQYKQRHSNHLSDTID